MNIYKNFVCLTLADLNKLLGGDLRRKQTIFQNDFAWSIGQCCTASI